MGKSEGLNLSQNIRGRAVFILLFHEPNDCIYQYNLAYSLRNAGWYCELYSACDNHLEVSNEYTYTFDGVSLSLRQRAEQIKDLLGSKRYDIAICDTPLAVSLAHHYAKKVAYFVTEWYPSKKNLRGTNRFLRPFKFLMLILASLWAGIRSNAFLYGESYKIKPFKLLFPWKPAVFVSYYPRLDMFPSSKSERHTSPFTFLYAGPLTAEKGWERVKRLVTTIAKKQQKKRWQLLVLSDRSDEFEVPNNLAVTYMPYLPYRSFCDILYNVDLCLDLRDIDYENTRCLPIKLFQYIAVPTNVLYSDLKAIHKDAPEIAKMINLVQPDDLDKQIEISINFVNSTEDNTKIYRRYFEQMFNWNLIENNFISFVKRVINRTNK